MKISQKSITINAWKKQMHRYEKGPVIGEKYLYHQTCELCKEFNNMCTLCPLTSLKPSHSLIGCYKFNSYIALSRTLPEGPIKVITPQLTKAMQVRFEFYKKYLPVLESLPNRRFVKSGFRGFPELSRED